MIPPKCLCEVLDITAPWLLSAINSSLSSGCIPIYLNRPVCNHSSNKSGLTLSDYKYSSVSELPFIRKLLEKTVWLKLLEGLYQNIFEVLTLCLLRWQTYVLGTDGYSVLVLLDLGATFDAVDQGCQIPILHSRCPETFKCIPAATHLNNGKTL